MFEFADCIFVTALEEEREALLRKLPKPGLVEPRLEDTQTYYQCTLDVSTAKGTGHSLRVVILTLLRMGRVPAAIAVANAVRRWRPRYVLLVGIAGGGAAQGVRLGDILIADQLVDYELQKIRPGGAENRFVVHGTDPRLLGAATTFREDEWATQIERKRPEDGKPIRHIGPMATGDKVICDTAALDPIRKAWPKLIGLEMEAGGAAAACFEASRAPGFFMVRGVSDLADPAKETATVKQWREYACDVAATYAVALLRSGRIPRVDDPVQAQLPPGFQRQFGLDDPASAAESHLKKALDAGVQGPLFERGGLCSGHSLKPLPDRYYVAETVGMSAGADLRAALTDGLRSLGRLPVTAAEQLGSGPALCKISALIRGTPFGVYELTPGQGHNCFLQLGIALGLGRPCILLRRGSMPFSTIADGLDSYSMESYLQLRHEIAGQVESLLVDVASTRIPKLPPAGSGGTAFVSTGDLDVLDFAVSVARPLASAGIHAVFLNDPTGKLAGFLEREELPHRILGTGLRWQLDEAIEAIQTARVGIFRIGMRATPDASLALGIALALNRPGILVYEREDAVPSNLAGLSALKFATFGELERLLPSYLRRHLV
jgi:nucleoside phosphorylase